jgi:hypothetical protein
MPGILFRIFPLVLLTQRAPKCSAKGAWWCVQKFYFCCLRNLCDQSVSEYEVERQITEPPLSKVIYRLCLCQDSIHGSTFGEPVISEPCGLVRTTTLAVQATSADSCSSLTQPLILAIPKKARSDDTLLDESLRFMSKDSS